MPDRNLGKGKGIRALSGKVVYASEVLVITIAEVLVIASILVATAIICTLFVGHIADGIRAIENLDQLQASVEKVFAGVLLLMLGMELLKCLTTFFIGFQVQVEIILIVAMIAVARHVMLIDIEHADWRTLVGSAALILGLGAAYALVRLRPGRPARAPDEG